MSSYFSNFRNFLQIHNNATSYLSYILQHRVFIASRFCMTAEHIKKSDVTPEDIEKSKTISKAMRAYLNRAKEHNAFMKREIAEYEIGKRHLANMMGVEAETLTKLDINEAIQYLFPSGLFDPRARPIMKHPEEIFPRRKAAEFDETGRPHHCFFYTGKPHYNEMLYNLVEEMDKLNDLENNLIKNNTLPKDTDKFHDLESEWLSKVELEKLLVENVIDTDYEYFLTSFNKLLEHPMSAHASTFIMKYRKLLNLIVNEAILLPIEKDDAGRPYVFVKSCKKKSAEGQVTIRGNGSGKITINGEDISYFHNIQSREQVIFPLIFTDMSDKVDVEATINGGGYTGQAAAIRWGIAWGLRSFVDKGLIEKMRIAGLLTKDWRRRERKKFGQEGARRKFTWKKR